MASPDGSWFSFSMKACIRSDALWRAAGTGTWQGGTEHKHSPPRGRKSLQLSFAHWTAAQTSQTDSEGGNDPLSLPGQGGSPVLTPQFTQHFLSIFLHLSAALNAAD